MAAARAAFLALLDDEHTTVYGVTSGFGDRATLRLSAEERAEQAKESTDRGVSFGEPLPERVTRGIVFARLANLVDGHGAVRPQVAEAVAGMLRGGELPRVPSQGNGGSGEILALGHLFDPMGRSLGLEEKDGNALVNGSPCGAALLADGALAAEGRLALAYEALALSVEAFAAPLEAYDRELAGLWGTRARRPPSSAWAHCSQERAASERVTRRPSAFASFRACSGRPSGPLRPHGGARHPRSRPSRTIPSSCPRHLRTRAGASSAPAAITMARRPRCCTR